MKEAIRKINSRNQVTIPKEMLNMLRAKRGDYVKLRGRIKERLVEINNVKIIDID